jgi:hypothetical protein
MTHSTSRQEGLGVRLRRSGGSNNCYGMTSLAAGATCNLYVMFTPTTTGAESARIVVNDDANNSPQTVYLSGTGQ